MTEATAKQQLLANTHEVENLDVLRSVAVSSVFFAHLYNFMRPGYSATAWHFGQLGVLMFFVHTALVLMLSLERQQAEGLPLFSAFYIRRWFRLYPLSIFFVVVAYLVPIIVPGKPALLGHWTVMELLANLSLTQNVFRQSDMVGGLWTLPLEVQMYVMLPFLFVFLRNKSWPWVIGLMVLSVPLAFVTIVVTDRLSVLAYVPCFLGGVLAWRLSRRYAPIFPGWLWPVGLAASSLIWFRADNFAPHDVYLRWVFCASLGAIIPMFYSMGNSVVTRVAAIVAKYSYGIYLSHILVMTIAFRLLRMETPLLQWGIFLSLAIIVPVLAFHLLESPMIRLGRRWQRSNMRIKQPQVASENSIVA